MTETRISLPAEEVADGIKNSLDYLAAMLIPDVAESPFPDFYNQVWVFILQTLHSLPANAEDAEKTEEGIRSVFRFALGLPRGHAKTTFIKLLVCYLVLHDYKMDFIQIVCATEPLAENFLDDVHIMLQSPVVTQVYGAWTTSLTRDTRKVKHSNWHGRSLLLVAIGAGTATRGLNLKNRRPQLIICDDAQTKENDESDVDSLKLLTWLVGTLFKSLTKTKRRAILFIGNMYSENCILYKFSKMTKWHSLITGGILADGTALWPAIQTVPEMLEEYDHDNELGQGAIWFAEIQNDPVGSKAGLLDFGESVPPPPDQELKDIELYPTRFITVDPAGMKATSDDNVVATHCIMEEDITGTMEIKRGKWSPDKVILEIIVAILEHKAGIVFIEANAYQGTLAFWLEKSLEEAQMSTVVIPIHTGTASKFRRIKAWVKLLVHGKWKLLSKKAYNLITYQLYSYRTNKTNNVDDILDVCAQAVLAINKHGVDILAAAPYDEVEELSMKQVHVQLGNTRTDLIRAAQRGM